MVEDIQAQSVEVTNRFHQQLARKEAKEGRRYKQKEIAEAAGLSPAVISRWINDVDLGSSTIDTVAKLCGWLDCDIGDLLTIRAGDEDRESR